MAFTSVITAHPVAVTLGVVLLCCIPVYMAV